MASGSGAVLAPVPSVAAARATGLPIVNLFRPATQPIAPPVTVAAPMTALDRAKDFTNRARAGLANLLGMAPVAPTPVAQPLSQTNVLEKQLDDLQKRSTMNVFQMRQAQATKPKTSTY